MRLLIVDDEPDLCEILSFNLESEGFSSKCAYSAEDALGLIDGGEQFDLILLDVMMERMSGIEMARLMRSRGDNTPIIFLTARNAEEDMLKGFSVGADDYITKPFSFPTVLARIKAVLKRSSVNKTGQQATYNCGGLAVDTQHKTVTIDGIPAQLTKKEYDILALLLQNTGSHFTRQEVINAVWDDNIYISDRSVDVHIARLRKKLGPYADNIVNHSGFGYTFVPSTENK